MCKLKRNKAAGFVYKTGEKRKILRIKQGFKTRDKWKILTLICNLINKAKTENFGVINLNPNTN